MRESYTKAGQIHLTERLTRSQPPSACSISAVPPRSSCDGPNTALRVVLNPLELRSTSHDAWQMLQGDCISLPVPKMLPEKWYGKWQDPCP